MSNVLNNIKFLAGNEGISVTKLEEKIGASKGVLSRAIAKNSDIQVKWLLRIIENYPLYSCDWLLRNQGPMQKQTLKDLEADTKEKEFLSYFKDLAESRKETIDSLKKEISHLEEKLSFYRDKE